MKPAYQDMLAIAIKGDVSLSTVRRAYAADGHPSRQTTWRRVCTAAKRLGFEPPPEPGTVTPAEPTA